MLNTSSHSQNTHIDNTMGLVAEGGGQKGAFTAGVLDSWQVANFNPFTVLIGTSAGAQNIASYLSKQTGYAYSLLVDLTRAKRFFNPWRWLTGNNALDLDWYFAHANKKAYQFDHVQANKSASSRAVRFSASDSSKMVTKLIDPSERGWLDAMRLSSSIPYLYRSSEWVDGGVTAPIPVREAHQLGAKTIVTIRTAVNSDNVVPKPIKQLKPFVCRGQQCPNFIKLLDQHEAAYRHTEQFINNPPKGVKVLEIKPKRALLSKVLGSSKSDIIADYKHGFELGQKFLQAHPELSKASINL